MKKNQQLVLVITLLVSNLFWIGYSIYSANTASNQTNQEWRQAATPIFKARGVPGLAENASPWDLKEALDANSAMTRAEAYKLMPPYINDHGGIPTKIIIVPETNKWARIN